MTMVLDSKTIEIHPYASMAYAALFENAEAVRLHHTHSSLLLRRIPHTNYHDAMGCYPVFVFQPSVELEIDFGRLAERNVISLVVVTDCLTHPELPYLERHFDVCRPYKTHYLHDCHRNAAISKHHLKEIKYANQKCECRLINLADYLDEWWACYETLTARHHLDCSRSFSREFFRRMSQLPELVSVGAFVGDTLVSAHLWILAGKLLYSHSAASTDHGYRIRASYAIYAHLIEFYGEKLTIDFGGVSDTGKSGLRSFKAGFANCDRENYLCGKVLHKDIYHQLVREASVEASTYFPAYRTPRHSEVMQ